jgi:N-acetyl-anhydromuramyl-L-alanine amidase AmpD
MPSPNPENPNNSPQSSSEVMGFLEGIFRQSPEMATETAESLNTTPRGEKFEAIPYVSEKQIKDARRAAKKAIRTVKKNKKLRKKLKESGIETSDLKNPDFYIALAIKESHLDPTDISGSGARGWFQIMQDALDETNKRAGTTLSLTDLHYPKDANISSSEKTTKQNYNALVGIAYWHIIREFYLQDHYPKKLGISVPEEDLDKATDFSYNLGAGGFSRLWAELQPKDFEDFETKIAEIVAQNCTTLKVPKDKKSRAFTNAYNISFTTFLELKQGKTYDDFKEEVEENKIKGKKAKKVQIGQKEYRVGKLERVLRYVETINALRNRKGPEYRVFSNSGDNQLYMWSIASELRDKYAKIFPFFSQKTRIRSSEKLYLLIKIITNYNIAIKNPAFLTDDIEKDSEDPELEDKTKVYLSPIEFAAPYLAEALGKDLLLKTAKLIEDTSKTLLNDPTTAPTETEEDIETLPPLHCGKRYCAETPQEVKELEKKGKEKIKFEGTETVPKKPQTVSSKKVSKIYRKVRGQRRKKRFDVKKYKVTKILSKDGYEAKFLRPKNIPDKLFYERPNGSRAKKTPTHIVLHSTEGGIDGLYRSGNIHYVVRPNGEIIEIRNPKIPLNHAGRISHPTHKANWDGDGNVSYKSIGIEIETRSVTEYVKKDKIDLPPPKNATIITQKIGKQTLYYTTNNTPPEESTRKAAHKQSAEARKLTDEQYKTMELLITYLGDKYGIRIDHTVAHSMIGVTRFGSRGRKSDPPNFDFTKALPIDNYKLKDLDAEKALKNQRGGITPHYKRMAEEMTGTKLERSKIMLSSPQEITMVEYDDQGKEIKTKVKVKDTKIKNLSKKRGKRNRRLEKRVITIKKQGKKETFKLEVEKWEVYSKGRKVTKQKIKSKVKHGSKTISIKAMFKKMNTSFNFPAGELFHELIKDSKGDLNYNPYSFFGGKPSLMLTGVRGVVEENP